LRPLGADALDDRYVRYLRSGVATPAEVVFSRLDALVAKRRAELVARIDDAA